MRMLEILKKTEVYFLFILVVLNSYLAVALRGESSVDTTHLMIAIVMLVMLNDKILDKIKKN